MGAPVDPNGEQPLAPLTPKQETDLAQANLLRMRGEYKQAVDMCLSLLKQNPDAVAAYSLLGDIHAEMDELRQAATWYEMAIELDANSELDKSKLAHVRERITDREASETVKQLGISPSKSNAKLLVALTTFVIMIVGVAMYFVGQASARRAMVIDDIPDVTLPTVVIDQDENIPTANDFEPVEPGQLPEVVRTERERNLLATLGRSRFGPKIVDVEEDPRTSHFTVTAAVFTNDPFEIIVGQIGFDLLSQMPDARWATVRLQSASNLLYVADVRRESFERFRGSENFSEMIDFEAASLLIDREWPVRAISSTLDDDVPPSPPGEDSTTN